MEYLNPLTLSSKEKELCAHVKRGEIIELGKEDRIQAEVIRRLVLGLPFDQETSLISTIRSFFEEDKISLDSSKTPVGISIKSGIIEGRLDLASALREDGGPVCPLEFDGCHFEQGLSGTHGRFSRLSFKACRFSNPPDRDGRPVPTIDLSGAAIDSDLDMAEIKPERIDRDGERPRGEGNHLWIRAIGARIDGEIDLSGSHLRAPLAPDGLLISEEAADALDLTLAQIEGDLQLINGARCEGRIKFRAARLAGDAWLSGATIENPRGQALLVQGTRIDGFLMLDGCFDDVEKKRPFRKFRCSGMIKLEASEIGRSLWIEDAVVRGGIEAPSLSVRDDLILHAEITGSIDLTGCRIGGSLDISKLNLAETSDCVRFRDGSVGRSLKLARPTADYRLVRARQVALTCIPGLKLVETLWSLPPGVALTDESGEEAKLDRRLVQAAFLVDDQRPRRARIFHLDGHADVLDRAVGRYGHGVTDEAPAFEYARLHGAYVLGGHGFLLIEADKSVSNPVDDFTDAGDSAHPGIWRKLAWAVADDRRRLWHLTVSAEGRRVAVKQDPMPGPSSSAPDPRHFENGLIVRPTRPPATWNEPTDPPWLALDTLDGMEPFQPLPGLTKRMAHHIEANPLLQARFDLDGLTCDLLDDRGGSAWGEHFDRIHMNHFVYRRANWGSAQRKTGSAAEYTNRVLGILADWLWRGRDGAFAERLRGDASYLEPWQVRRNWIYRQFGSPILPHLISISRFRFGEQAYRPQPFEQAILVARAEGREDFAVRFEMMKSHNEWRFFKERGRWWLGPIAITLASLWLFLRGGSPFWTALAWAVTLAMMVGVSRISDALKEGGGWRRGLLRAFAVIVPGAALLVGSIWLAIALGPVRWAVLPFLAMVAALLWLNQAGAWVREGISGWWPRRIAREFVFYVPALLLLIFDWWPHPFHYLVSFLFYAGIRSAGSLANLVMWWGFGYLRRPTRAIASLLLAFCLGWWGVDQAATRNMLVINAAPTATLAASDSNLSGADGVEHARVMGSPLVPENPGFVRELSCVHELSKPLYALDVLIPLVDLNEEGRCEVRRIPDHDLEIVDPDDKSWSVLWQAVPRLPLDDNRFWWWAKAIYAVLGWILVSLSILTFAQVNKVHAEPPHEHK
jgi:hypothetical protein